MKACADPHDIVCISAVRTPSGKFGGALRDLPVFQLGAAAITEALSRARISPDEIGEVLLGSCRHAGNGTNPARTAARLAGLPGSTPAATITMACASGMRAVISGVQSLFASDTEIVVTGGMESMSTIPHLLLESRWHGLRLGHTALFDGWHDSRDPILDDRTTGLTTEALVKRHGISREEQDRFAFESHQKSSEAESSGLFKEELVSIPACKLDHDETIRADTSLAKLSALKPAFLENGTLTAGNSSSLSDGAAVLVLTRREKARELGAPPLFTIISYASGAVDNKIMGEGPAHVLPMALKKAGMSTNDLDLIELNEGFAGMAIANERLLKLDRGKLNKNGGAIALGHPVGASGARILVTLTYLLKHTNKEIGGAVIGAAGGVCTAMIIRRES